MAKVTRTTKTCEVSQTSDVSHNANGFKETEVGDIPQEWEVTTLGSLGKVVTGTTPSTKQPKFYDGPYKLISPADLGDHKYVQSAHKWLTEAGLNVARELPRDTVLIGCIGNVGKTGLTSDERSATNQQINAIICESHADPHFVYYLMTHRRAYLESFAVKTTVPILNKGNFEEILIPLPPLPEQREIAHVLGTIQRAMAAQEAVIAAAREVKRSLMRRLFTFGPYADPLPTRETEIGEVPESWQVTELGRHVTIRSGGTPSRKEPKYWGGKIPWVKTTEINYCEINDTEEKITPEGLDNSSARLFP